MCVFFALHVHDDFLRCIYVIVMPVGMWTLRNLPDGAVHVFSSCRVCLVELTFLLMFFPKWLCDKQSTLQ